MKKGLLSLLSICFYILSLSAQAPQVTNSVFPIPGTSVLIKGIDEFYLQEDYKKSGPSQVWNFSDLNYLEDTARLGYLPVEETPYAGFFPDANIAMTYDKEEYQYFKFDENGYRMVGTYKVDSDIGIGVQYVATSNHFFHTFPIQYGFKDSFTTTGLTTLTGLIEIADTHHILQEVDAYGMLIVDKDTFYNLVRVKEIGVRINTVKAIHPEAKSGEMISSYVRYQWWGDGLKTPILTISEGHYEDSRGGSRPTKSLSFATEIPKYLSNPQFFPLDLKIHSLAQKEVLVTYQINAPAVAYVELRDISGRLIENIEQNIQDDLGLQKAHFNVQNLSKGIYIITVVSSQQMESIKIFIDN